MLETAQFAEFASAVVRQLPRDLDPTTAQGWIQNQRALADTLRKVLKPESESVTIQVSDTGALQPPYNGWDWGRTPRSRSELRSWNSPSSWNRAKTTLRAMSCGSGPRSQARCSASATPALCLTSRSAF